MDNTSKYRVPALDRGFDILEELARSARPLTLTQLANRLGRSTNEIFRVLNGLEQRGYVRRDDATATYGLSLKLYELAHQHPPLQNLLNAAARPMEMLADALGESCHLGVLRRGRLVVLQQALSPTPVRLSIDVGGRFSAIHTASGRLLLAQLAADELAAFLAADAEYQALSDAARSDLADRLAQIRQADSSVAEHETHVGVRDYAVLVGNPAVGVSAALAVAALTPIHTPIDSAKILRTLQACCRDITKELGLLHESTGTLL